MNMRRIGRALSVYGQGGFGGKGDGLVLIEDAMPSLNGIASIKPVDTVILASGIDGRFRENGMKLDERARSDLSQVLAHFGDCPVSVRPSEKGENDPALATSGDNTSFMLPNSHIDAETRLSQFIKAIELALIQHQAKNPDQEGLAIVVNRIDGIHDRTKAGDFFYPMSSVVADSFFCYPVAGKKAEEGFARVAFGHGYSTVRSDFDVIPMLTIMNPEKPGSISRGQRFFYAIDMGKNSDLQGRELETMSMLALRHADPSVSRHFGNELRADFDELIANDGFGYRSALQRIVSEVSSALGPCQLECTFNIEEEKGVFRIVQFKRMRDMFRSRVEVPDDGRRVLIATDHVQGHGIWEGITDFVVIDPFNYSKDMHGEVVQRLMDLNQELMAQGRKYILVSPGRVGTSNLDWGINVEYKHISGAAAIVEYGYDISGSSEIAVTRQEMTGGIYGSHFLYQMLGGAELDERIRMLRMLGSQGTHFMTNLVTSGAVFLHVDPKASEFDPGLFSPPEGEESSPIYHRKMEEPLSVYADIFSKRGLVK